MRQATWIVAVGAIALSTVAIAVATSDDGSPTSASSCRTTLVATNSGIDVEPDLAIYDDGEKRILTPSSWHSVGPTFSPDGDDLALIRSNGWGGAGPSASELWIVPTNGDLEEAKPAVDAPGIRIDPSWSPEGDEIAYVKHTDSGDGRALRIVDTDGGNDREVATAEDYLFSPTWSPDASAIAYIDQRLDADLNDSTDDIEILELTTGDTRRVATIPGASDLSWSPDGSSILVSTYESEDGALLLLDPDTGDTTNVAEDATMAAFADDETIFFLDRISQGDWQLATGSLEDGRMTRRARIGDDVIYAYGFFGLDPVPCSP